MTMIRPAANPAAYRVRLLSGLPSATAASAARAGKASSSAACSRWANRAIGSTSAIAASTAASRAGLGGSSSFEARRRVSKDTGEAGEDESAGDHRFRLGADQLGEPHQRQIHPHGDRRVDLDDVGVEPVARQHPLADGDQPRHVGVDRQPQALQRDGGQRRNRRASARYLQRAENAGSAPRFCGHVVRSL